MNLKTQNPSFKDYSKQTKIEIKKKEFTETLASKVIECYLKNYSSATIGHILKAQYNIKIKKLCKHFPFLDPVNTEITRLNTLNKKRQLHYLKNKKDYCVARALVSSEIKYFKMLYSNEKKANEKKR